MKLHEIGKSDPITKWFDKYGRVTNIKKLNKNDPRSTNQMFLDAVRSGESTGLFNIDLDGINRKLVLPMEIKELYDLNISQFLLDDYTKLPKVRNLKLFSCKVAGDFVDYARNNVADSCILFNTKMKIDDALSVLEHSPWFSYKFTMPHDIRAVFSLQRTGMDDFGVEVPADHKHFYTKDVFELQDWLIENVNVKKWFL